MRNRIAESSVPVTEAGCWIWTGGWKANGYGVLNGHSNVLAHRASYEAFNGEIPEGYEVCHRCDTPACVNPEHLFVGTTRDNARDSANKGRRKFNRMPGERNPSARLTEQDAIAVFHDRRPARAIAEELGVSESLVRHIRTGRKWASVTGAGRGYGGG